MSKITKKNNGTERYAKRIDLIETLVKIQKRLQIEAHEERQINSLYIKLGTRYSKQKNKVDNLRDMLLKANEEFAKEYPNVGPMDL